MILQYEPTFKDSEFAHKEVNPQKRKILNLANMNAAI